MEPYGRSRPPEEEWTAPPAETGLEESMWQWGLGGVEAYPERPGEPDCTYYLRTGFCGFGGRCRFNHPQDRGGAVAGGGYPERAGEPVCKYFIRTGTCNYGASCKYHHPRYGSLSESMVSLNYHGYPLRPDEKECSYYVKTGQCKFGMTCKFHHPQPASISMSPTAPTFYTTVQSPAVPSPSQYGATSWQVARPPPLPGSFVQGPYNPMLLSPAVVRFPGWGPYSPPLSPVVQVRTQQTVGTGWLSGLTQQVSPSITAYTGPYSSVSSAGGPSSNSPKELMFPERPGQTECLYYMKTGDCKYGSSCRYHHPPERGMPKSSIMLSPIGLPLRPGVPPCNFYSQNGYCMFGPTCKFDHPMGPLSHSPSASSLADIPVAPYPIGLSLGTLAPPSTSELRRDFFAGPTQDSSSTRMPSSDNTSSGTVGSIFSRAGVSAPQSHAQLTGRSSVPSSGSSGIGHGRQS